MSEQFTGGTLGAMGKEEGAAAARLPLCFPLNTHGLRVLMCRASSIFFVCSLRWHQGAHH